MACVLTVVAVLASPALAAENDPAVTATVLEDTPNRIVIQYQLNDFQSEPVVINGQKYSELTLGKESLLKEVGAPALPRVCRSVIIPDNAQMSVNVLSSEHYDVSNIVVAPSKGFILRTTNPDDVPYTFGAAYSTDGFHPGALATMRDPYILRDYRAGVVEFYPLQNNPVTRTLRVYTDVTIELVKVGPGQINVLNPGNARRTLLKTFDELYSHQFINYSTGSRYTPLDEQGDMLIICYDAWLTNIQPFVDHKAGIGIAATAVGVSTIGNTATAIKSYIQGVYDSSDLAFVLLVGDGAQVATPYASGGASDPSYSKLAGSDNYPDILVGRFSAENASQVDTQVERSIEHEQNQLTQADWYWRGMGVASNEGPGHNGEYDNQHMDLIRQKLLTGGYTLVDQLYAPSANAGQVTSGLNAGRGIINYCGHGSTTSWGTTGFSNTHVNALTNDNMLPWIISVACVNGEFDGPTCFAEAWLRATNGGEPTGAVGTYMSSINQSWSPPMDGQEEVVDRYLDESYSCYGTLCFAGSCKMMDLNGSGGVTEFDTWHVFGDPSLCVVGTTQPASGLRVLPPDDMSSTGPVSGPFTPESVEYVIENMGDDPLDFTVVSTAPWVSIENGTGSLPGRAVTTVTVSINSEANLLDGGIYHDVVEFINTTTGEGDCSRNVALEVGGPAWDPVAYDVITSTALSTPSDIMLSASDPNGDPLSCTIESLPAVGGISDPGAGVIETVPYTLVGGGNTVTYTPPPGQYLQETFDFSVQDATAGSNIATVTVTVGGAAWDPVAHDMNLGTAISLPTDITLSASDPNGDPLTFTIESLPDAGGLSDPGAGAITGVPYTLVGGGSIVTFTPPWGQTIQTTFGFSVQDATAVSNTATVTVDVGVEHAIHSYLLNADPSWGTSGQWAFGQPTGGGSNNPDPTGGYTGNNVLGYNLEGDYENGMVLRYLTSGPIDCTHVANAELRFQRWLGVESSYFDHANIQISTNGMTWSSLWEHDGAAIGETSWSLRTFDIASIADGQPAVFIRWGMGPTDTTTTYSGWNLDDIVIWGLDTTPVPLPCDDVIFTPGDVNLDGSVNGVDIQTMAQMLLNPVAAWTPEQLCAGDFSDDDAVTLADVDAFVQELLN